MSKDHHENILQESLQKLEEEEEEQQQQQQEKGGVKKGGVKEGGGVASREGVEEEEQQQQQQRKQEEKGEVEKDEVKEEGGVAAREGVEEEEEEEGFRTPTSSDHKIPIIQSCPPTPKKKVRVSFVHKRKLSDLQSFETTRSEEVESFFRSNSAEPFTIESARSFKRRCKSA